MSLSTKAFPNTRRLFVVVIRWCAAHRLAYLTHVRCGNIPTNRSRSCGNTTRYQRGIRPYSARDVHLYKPYAHLWAVAQRLSAMKGEITMEHLSSRRCVSLAAGLVLGAVGIGSTVLLSGPAGADPKVPTDVWVQCTGFTSEPGFAFPHPLTGCTSRSGTGSGRTDNSSGTETIYWDKPFEGGKSLRLANPGTAPAEPGTTCPEGQTKQGVSGQIAPQQPLAGSPVTATICIDFETFSFKLAEGSLWTIHKVPGSPGDVNPPTTTTPTPTP
jgi:hypothetical protein